MQKKSDVLEKEPLAKKRNIYRTGRRDIFTMPPGFFERPNGGTPHPEYNMTLKATPGYMLRVYSTRAMKNARPLCAGRRLFKRLFQT